MIEQFFNAYSWWIMAFILALNAIAWPLVFREVIVAMKLHRAGALPDERSRSELVAGPSASMQQTAEEGRVDTESLRQVRNLLSNIPWLESEPAIQRTKESTIEPSFPLGELSFVEGQSTAVAQFYPVAVSEPSYSVSVETVVQCIDPDTWREKLGLEFRHASSLSRSGFLWALDEAAAQKEAGETLILIDLDFERTGAIEEPWRVEVFYEGVSAVTNFKRTKFETMNDLETHIRELKGNYAKVTWVTGPSLDWEFTELVVHERPSVQRNGFDTAIHRDRSVSNSRELAS